MNQNTTSRMELFASNIQSLKGKFVWQNTLLKQLAALLYAAEDRRVDYDAIRESLALIKSSTGLFSSFRGNSAITLATLLSLHEAQETQLANTLAVYAMLKESNFWASDYLVIAAYQIAANTSKEKYAQTIGRAKAFYDGMKAQHYFITGQNDYIFTVMLGLSDIELDSGLNRMEQLYRALKPEFGSANAVQALAQVLVLSGESTAAQTRVLDLCHKFRQRGERLDKEYTLSALGVLSLLPADADTLVNDVLTTYEYLRRQKGLGSWAMSKQEQLLFASALVSTSYLEDAKNGVLGTALSTSLTNIIIAQQTTIAVTASMSAAAASSGSS